MASRTDAASRKTLDTVGKLSLALSAGLAVALGASVLVAAQFEREMRNVASISPSVQRNFEGISDSLVDMSRTMPQSAKTLAQGLYDIVSSGFDGAEAMTVLKSSAMAASAGLTTTATSAKAITAVLNAYGLSGFEASRVSDILFQTVNKGVVSFEELAGVMGDFVGSTAAAGVPIEDASAALATMTLSGISASEAGTSLNRVMQSFIDPSEAMIAHLKEQGYESGMAALESLGLQGAMEMLRTTTGGNIETLVKLFPEIRAARGALALMADEGRNYADVAGAITDKTAVMGATQRAYTEQSKSFTFQLELAKNNLAAMAIEIGMAVLPALTSLVQMVGGVFTAFSDLPGPVKAVLGVMALVAAAAGALGGAFLLLAPRIAAAQTLMTSISMTSPTLASGLGMAATAATGVGIAMVALTAYLAITGKEKARLKALTDNLTDALKAERDGTRGAADAGVMLELSRKGLIASAEKYKVNLNDLIAAARGDEDAMRRVGAQTTATGDAKIKFAVQLAEVAGGYKNAEKAVNDEAAAMAAANPQIEETKKRFAEVEQILGPVSDALGTNTKALEDLDDIQKAYNESVKGFADGASVYKDVLNQKQEAEQAAHDSAKKGWQDEKTSAEDAHGSLKRQLAERIAQLQEKGEAEKAASGKVSEATAAEIDSLRDRSAAEDRAYGALKDSLEKSGKSWEEFKTSTEITLSEYNAGLERQIAAVEEWTKNYTAIFQRFGPQVATILATMGEEGRIIAAKMTADLEGEGVKTAELLPRLYGQAGVGATTDLFAGLAPSPAQTRKQVEEVSRAVTETLSPLPGWTGETAKAVTDFLRMQLDPAIPNTGAQAEATVEALRSRLAGLPGWTSDTAGRLVEFLASALSPMPGNTGQTAEQTAQALRSQLEGLPGWTQGAGSRTQAEWVGALSSGTGGTGAEAQAWAQALVGILNEILRGVGSQPISMPNGGFNRPGLAEGGIFEGGVQTFAHGTEDHRAQIAPAGAWRVWAEPETEGEAYIPFAQAKRGRSVEILRSVARRFGMDLFEYAYGGTTDDMGLPFPPTAEGWGHMVGRTAADADHFTYHRARDWVAEERRKAAEKAAAEQAGGGAPYSGGRIGSGWQQITGYLDSVGQPYTITSTYRAGDPGFHGRGKAVDMVGNMSAIFDTLAAGNPVPGINELFYDPMGYFYDEGRRASGAIGGHDDHVHAATFDKGGVLWPGYTLAYNGTGGPEAVMRFAHGGTYTGMGMDLGGFASRTAYRMMTGERAVYDDNVNGRPDAWESPNQAPAPFGVLMDPGGPPGIAVGMGGGGSTSIDASIHVDGGAVRVEVYVQPGASESVIDAAVRRAVNPAMQALVDRLRTQIRARVKV
ncbi:MAG: phage tail tape measure protein [Chloroflexi bacterium]|nr:phage tail tape measure protein [Chloroflexota bacterium]